MPSALAAVARPGALCSSVSFPLYSALDRDSADNVFRNEKMRIQRVILVILLIEV
jgi:hypothetical protein